MDKLYADRFIVVSYYASKRCLIQTWTDICSSEEFRAAQQKCVDLFVEKQCLNFVSDTTHAGLLKREDTDWAAAVITPQLVAAGMKHLEMVVPKNIFTKLTVQNLQRAEEQNNNTILRFYESLEQALRAL